MKLASHNSWSFLLPQMWWARPFRIFAQCQQISVIEQWEHGVRCFDLRVRFDKDGTAYPCHGLIRYRDYENAVFPHTLSILNSVSRKADRIWCRVMLEDCLFHASDTAQRDTFRSFCHEIQTRFKNIIFFGGWTKRGWRDDKVHDFGTQEPKILELHASVTGTIVDDILPLYYAEKMNALNKTAHRDDDDEFLMIDFVDI